MFFLRDLPKYDAIRARAARYPEVDPAAIESFLTLLRVGSDVLAAFERYLANHHISQGRFTVLMILNRNPEIGLNPSDLAAKCGVTRATMTGLLDSLERKRLIRRESAQADRRTVLVRLNDKGIELLEGMLHDYYRRISLLMGDLAEDDKRHLTAMLLKVAGGISHV
jgi:DNA-binding MarR family transcriptional regulator